MRLVSRTSGGGDQRISPRSCSDDPGCHDHSPETTEDQRRRGDAASRPVVRGPARRPRRAARAHPHDHRDRQRPLHDDDDEPGAPPPRRGVRGRHRVRPPAGQQPCSPLGLLVGISVLETTHGTTVANLGFEEVVFPTPMFAGDTMHGESEVVGAAGVEVATRPGHRHLRAPGLQPARRARVPGPPQRAHAPARRRERAQREPGAGAPAQPAVRARRASPTCSRKMPRAEPDGVALDLEDAVPADGKADGACALAARSAPSWRPTHPEHRGRTCG